MRKRISGISTAFFGLLLIAACSSRPAQIGVDANYIVEITNPSPHAMAVSLDLGANQMSALGSVGPGETKRFEIRDPATNDINLVASDGSGGHVIRKKVELSRSEVARVRLD
jgi:hypothetical protein